MNPRSYGVGSQRTQIKQQCQEAPSGVHPKSGSLHADLLETTLGNDASRGRQQRLRAFCDPLRWITGLFRWSARSAADAACSKDARQKETRNRWRREELVRRRPATALQSVKTAQRVEHSHEHRSDQPHASPRLGRQSGLSLRRPSSPVCDPILTGAGCLLRLRSGLRSSSSFLHKLNNGGIPRRDLN